MVYTQIIKTIGGKFEHFLGCTHFKRFVFEVVLDQVAGDLMSHIRWSSGGSQLLLKALHYHPWFLGFCVVLLFWV